MEFNNNKNYKVGYQNPPIETRFKKGVSGNRKGRPKGHKNFNTKLKYFLDGKISITNADYPHLLITVMKWFEVE